MLEYKNINKLTLFSECSPHGNLDFYRAEHQEACLNERTTPCQMLLQHDYNVQVNPTDLRNFLKPLLFLSNNQNNISVRCVCQMATNCLLGAGGGWCSAHMHLSSIA